MFFERLFFVVLVKFGLLLTAFGQQQPIRYFNEPEIKGSVVKTVEFEEIIGDSTASGTLFQNLSGEGLPLSYFREIKTSVCFDGKCRLLDIRIYWSPTGSYQGFELPAGEFLSKTDHDPFSGEEYLKLHTILSDSLSPLADYSFEELVPGTGDPSEVDAVSSATLKDILNYIVPGAAYTTYRLWHLVYGEAVSVITQLSERLYNEKFALALLESDQPPAQLWALSHLHKIPDPGDQLLAKVLELTNDKNLNIAATALASLKGGMLNEFAVQSILLQHVGEGEYTLKKPALLKLAEARVLHDPVRDGLTVLVPKLNGDLLSELLNVYLKHQVQDVETIRKVSKILESDNRYTAGKVFAFLESLNPQDEWVKKKMEAYKNRK